MTYKLVHLASGASAFQKLAFNLSAYWMQPQVCESHHLSFLLDVYPGWISPHRSSNLLHYCGFNADQKDTQPWILRLYLPCRHQVDYCWQHSASLGQGWVDSGRIKWSLQQFVSGLRKCKNLLGLLVVPIGFECSWLIHVLFKSYRMAICTQYVRLMNHWTRAMSSYQEVNLIGGPSSINVGK